MCNMLWKLFLRVFLFFWSILLKCNLPQQNPRCDQMLHSFFMVCMTRNSTSYPCLQLQYSHLLWPDARLLKIVVPQISSIINMQYMYIYNTRTYMSYFMNLNTHIDAYSKKGLWLKVVTFVVCSFWKERLLFVVLHHFWYINTNIFCLYAHDAYISIALHFSIKYNYLLLYEVE